MFDSFEKDNKADQPKVRPELALLKVFYDAGKDNLLDLFENRAAAARAAGQANIITLCKVSDLATAEAYKT